MEPLNTGWTPWGPGEVIHANICLKISLNNDMLQAFNMSVLETSVIVRLWFCSRLILS